MDARELFGMALGLGSPWFVRTAELDRDARRLTLTLDFTPGAKFGCPDCGAPSPVHDTAERRWRHLNFFQYETELAARVPRTKCAHDGVKAVQVPWARPGSGFTLLFEALVVLMGEEGVTTNAMGRIVNEHDTKLWRVLNHYVTEARTRADHSKVTEVAVDETSRAKGQNYVTTFVDPDQKRVLFVTEGRSAETVEEFRKDLEAHGGAVENIKHVSLDMSVAFQKGVTDTFPNAKMTFDKFHVIQLANKAVDEVRRAEAKQTPVLKGTRYAWLKNAEDLDDDECAAIEKARRVATKTASAYRYKTRLQELYKLTKPAAELEIVKWYDAAIRSPSKPIKRLGRTIRKHARGILNHWDSLLTNGIQEGFNSLIQAAKARARGYRSFKNMRTVIYLLLGRLDFRLPALLDIPPRLLATT